LYRRCTASFCGSPGNSLIRFGVPDGTPLNRFKRMRSRVYHACDMPDPGRGGGRHGALR
jgi:hypothetical protein